MLTESLVSACICKISLRTGKRTWGHGLGCRLAGPTVASCRWFVKYSQALSSPIFKPLKRDPEGPVEKTSDPGAQASAEATGIYLAVVRLVQERKGT